MTLSVFSQTILDHKYAKVKADGTKENWNDIASRVSYNVVDTYLPRKTKQIESIIASREFMPGGRYLYAAGLPFHQVQNCLLLDVEDSRQGWSGLMERVTSSLMTGAGIGIVYSKLRPSGSLIKGMGGKSTGPLALMQMVNEAGRHIMQGGSRRSAIWAGLHWNHEDIDAFIDMKNWSDDVRTLKTKDFNFPAPMDGTNISVILDDLFFEAYHDSTHSLHSHAVSVYKRVVRRMCKTGEPGFSIDVGSNAGEHLRNACTEVTSSDDNDICNLGSINLAQIQTIDQFAKVLELGTQFLLCGTLYSKVPYEAVADVRKKNRRLGLGLMGLHEWLLIRGKPYGPDKELEQWLKVYEESTGIAHKYADILSISRPVKTRAIAPTGTISIIAETSSGIEPIFCTAFKRRYLKGNTWFYQYVIDAAAERMIDKGVNPNDIEDAYSLAGNIERRLKFQAFVQKYVDHSISSTINLPEWNTALNNDNTVKEFESTLMQYLPELRGITTYPDGARGGQPLTSVSYNEAKDNIGVELQEYGNENSCISGVCGI